MLKRAVHRWHISRHNSSARKGWTNGRSASGFEIHMKLSELCMMKSGEWCKEWRQMVRSGSRLLTKIWTRGPRTARRKPQQPKVEIVRRAEKRPIVAEKLCYVIARGGIHLLHLQHHGELWGRESFRVAAATSSSKRDVPQVGELPCPGHAQRPGAWSLFIFQPAEKQIVGFEIDFNTLQGEGFKWWKYVLDPNFVHYYFLLQLDSFPIHHSF